MTLDGGKALARPKQKPDQINHPVLERLEAVRNRLGLSREAFAYTKLGVTGMTYYRWCTGKFKKLTLERVEELEKRVEELEGELERGSK